MGTMRLEAIIHFSRYSMKPRELPQPQVVSNIGMIDTFNPIVKRKQKPTNTSVPQVWSTLPGKAYRLLIGPHITDIDPSINLNTREIEEKDQKREVAERKRQKLLDNLVPSRLHKPFKPFDVTVSQLDALSFPSDLLYVPSFQDTTKSFDMVTLHKKRAKSKIIAPAKKSARNNNSSRFNMSYLERIHTKEQFQNTNTFTEEEEVAEKIEEKSKKFSMDDLRQLLHSPVLQEEEEQPDVDEEELKARKKQRLKEIEFLILERVKIHNFRQYRSTFFILRCWASTKINQRNKAGFISDVSDTQKKIHVLKSWHYYAANIRRLKANRKILNERLNFLRIQSNFQYWHELAERPIFLLQQSLKIKARLDHNITKYYFHQLQSVTHSKRVCRRNIAKYFRYNPNAKMTELVPFYQKKRELELKAQNYNFRRSTKKLLRLWYAFIQQCHLDKQNSDATRKIIGRIFLKEWINRYRQSVHNRSMTEIRNVGIRRYHKMLDREEKESEEVEKSTMIALRHHKQILVAKLKQFDRLAEHHREAIARRADTRAEIATMVNQYFIKKEEYALIDIEIQAGDADRQTREIRKQLAGSFIFHISRAARSFENTYLSRAYCIAFRELSKPVVNRAVGYFHEKRRVKELLREAIKIRRSIIIGTHCVRLYHEQTGFSILQKFISIKRSQRSNMIVDKIYRRVEVLKLFPYYGYSETLPMRQPRPLKEVEQMFKDLPLVSIQRKIARERQHHLNVRQAMNSRRLLRDFFRALASYTQEMCATRTVIKLMKKRKMMEMMNSAMNRMRANARMGSLQAERLARVSANIEAWMIHFFRARAKQRAIPNGIPEE